MLGRTGQLQQIESDVNRRTSRKENSKWAEVIYSRAFEKKGRGIRCDWKRLLRSPTLEGFVRHCLFCGQMLVERDSLQTRLITTEQDEKHYSHSGKRHNIEEETFLFLLLCLRDGNGKRF